MYWNCRGFPWHKGIETEALFGGADIILLGETWERDTCTIPQIPGFVVHSAMQKNKGHRGQGGVACIYRTQLQDYISVAKTDTYNRYIWLKIERKPRVFYLACCYIPHSGSTFYKTSGVDPRDPFEDLGLDVCHFSTQGDVMLMGDMNARIADKQAQPIAWDEIDKTEEVHIANSWQRASQDVMVNAQGRALCNLMQGMHLLALNGMHLFPHTQGYTCHTASDGHSVVDYALLHLNAIHIVNKFELGHRIPESDHVAIHMYVTLGMGKDGQVSKKNPERPQRLNDKDKV